MPSSSSIISRVIWPCWCEASNRPKRRCSAPPKRRCLCSRNSCPTMGLRSFSPASQLHVHSHFDVRGHELGGRILPFAQSGPASRFNTLFYVVILWLLFAVPGTVRRWRRIRRGLCPACAPIRRHQRRLHGVRKAGCSDPTSRGVSTGDFILPFRSSEDIGISSVTLQFPVFHSAISTKKAMSGSCAYDTS